MTSTTYDDPRDVPCPWCGAAAGAGCRTPLGKRAPIHAPRFYQWQDKGEEQQA